MNFLVLVVAFAGPWLSSAGIARTQEPSSSPSPSVDKAELRQALLDLANAWTVMCVAAHPDDEDGTTLTVLRREYGVHTVSVFSTYGEGGQNAVGPELYEELGVIRVRETINASRIQGSEPYFLGLNDFGFSKSAEEAFRFWGHDEALRRLVLKIRELRPDVIITNHDTTSGHGHHQATGRLVLEAFDAAADPRRFPEQLTLLKPWQTQRLFVRIFGSGNSDNKNTGSEKIVAIDPNEVDPVRGTSFAAQSLSALQQHATQGPWPKSVEAWLKARRIETGKLPPVRYRLVREAQNSLPLPVNATTLLDGLKLPAPAAGIFVSPTIENKPLTGFLDRPDRVLDELLKYGTRPNVSGPADDSSRLDLFQSRFNKAVALAAGMMLAVSSHNDGVVPGEKTAFSITLANSGNRTVEVKNLSFN
ncbi:MAG: PIG-L deacetylase family protein, partial [Pyrinomonadaceae bacterium]